jgi:hypothetical protein
MIEAGRMKMLTIALVLGALGGPAVAVGLGWMWREEILASKRERHAITKDKYAGKSILEVEGEQKPPIERKANGSLH